MGQRYVKIFVFLEKQITFVRKNEDLEKKIFYLVAIHFDCL